MPTLELSDKDKIELDKIDRAIIDYVTKHDGCTKNAVRTELNKKDKRISSPKTTNQRINGLIENKVLRYDKKGKGFYQLHVTDNTPYLEIRKQIERIELFADKIYEPLKELDKFSRGVGFVGGAIPTGATIMYMNKFVMPYFTSLFTMLGRLLELSSSDKISVVDSHDLNIKIIAVMDKIRNQPQVLDRKQIFDTNKRILTRFRDIDLLSRPGGESIIKNLDSKVVNDLINIIEDFEKNF